MIHDFTYWYRNHALKHDSRAVWWEHVITFVPPVSAIGVWLTHWSKSIWPFAILTLASALFSIWSYVQDCAVQKIVHGESLEWRHDVAIYTRIYGVIFVVLFIWITSRWLYSGL
jgi:hypothetical protein